MEIQYRKKKRIKKIIFNNNSNNKKDELKNNFDYKSKIYISLIYQCK